MIIKKLNFVLCVFSLFFISPTHAEVRQSDEVSKIGCYLFIENIHIGDGFYNAKNKQVTELQEKLHKKGYLTVAPTGYFGPLTFRAVINYQKDNGIIQTGFVGPITRGVLRSQFCNETQPIAICDYAAPPNNCDYIEGPSYNNQTHCGMILSCNSQTSPVASTSCKVWYDGCNTCTRSNPEETMACTMMYCTSHNTSAATCKEYFP